MSDEDLERQVALALHEIYPEPTGTTLTIPDGRPRRHSRALAIVAVVALVAAVAVLAGLLQAGTQTQSANPPRQPSATSDPVNSRSAATTTPVVPATITKPDALVAHTWELVRITHAARRVNTVVGGIWLQLYRSHGMIGMTIACNSSVGDIGAGRIVFHQPWINDLMMCPDLGIQESKFAYGKVLVGTVNWSITGRELTITKANVGSLSFEAVNGRPTAVPS